MALPASCKATISCMIEELICHVNYERRFQVRTNLSMLLPEPAEKSGDVHERSGGKDQKERTFSMYPQQRSSGFPFSKYITLTEPLRGAVMMKFGCEVIVG